MEEQLATFGNAVRSGAATHVLSIPAKISSGIPICPLSINRLSIQSDCMKGIREYSAVVFSLSGWIPSYSTGTFKKSLELDRNCFLNQSANFSPSAHVRG